MAKPQNNPGVGTEYEVLIPAYFSLNLYKNTNVKDFSIRSNETDFGNLDDVIIDIEMIDTSKYYFAIQLKHKENKNKKILPTNFEAKGDFNLEKYCKAYKKIKHKNYYFIIYTNSEYNTTSKETSKFFQIIQEDDCKGRLFFDTSSKPESIYRFDLIEDIEIKGDVTELDYKEFFGKLTLYVGQKNFEGIEEEVFGILKDKNSTYKYLDLFRKWHHHKFTNNKIDRKTVNIQLVDVFLSDFYILDYEISTSKKLFERIVREFQVTIITESKHNVVKNLTNWGNLQLNDDIKKQLLNYLQECYIDKEIFEKNPDLAIEKCLLFFAKKYKLVDNFATDLVETTKKKLFCYFFGKPILIDFQKFSGEIIYKLLELYNSHNTEIKFVFIGQNIDLNKFSRFSIFNNLHQLKFKEELLMEVVQNCELSLQGKNRIKLVEIIDNFDNLEFIGSYEILKMLNQEFVIGEDKEILPEIYINRKLSCYGLKTVDIIKTSFLETINIVVDFNQEFQIAETIFKENGVNLIEIDTWSEFTSPRPSIFVNYHKTETEIIELLQEKTNIIYLKMINSSFFLPIFYRIENQLPLYKFITSEDQIHKVYDSNLNIICAQPGMGKSTLLKLLKNQLANYWSCLVDLKAHISFLRTKHSSNEIINYFLQQSSNNFLENLKSAFIKHKKVVFFFDGLDELDNQCVDNTLDFIEILAGMSFRIWFSSRENLDSKLQKRFNKFLISIEEVSPTEQIKYITERPEGNYEEEEITIILDKIFTSSDIIDNRQVLAIPLQLYIITQTFLDDKNQYYNMTNNIFVLTKMYSLFFNGRYKHTIDKQEAKNKDYTVGDPEDYFEKYEILALQFLLHDDIFIKLNLMTRSSKRFLENIKKDKDPLGIIIKINNENKAVFDHLTYAEYFACVLLANNFNIIKQLRDELYSNRYKNLLFILNIMLAEENPLHLAIIYKNLEQIQNKSDNGHFYDKAGRNPLHLFSYIGTKFPGCFTYEDGAWSFKTSEFLVFVEEIIKDKQILNVIKKFDYFKQDELFNWNCLDYFFKSGTLCSVETILEEYKISLEDIKPINLYTNQIFVFTFFCTLSGNVNILEITKGDFDLNQLPKSILYYTINQGYFRKLDLVKFWLDFGYDVNFNLEENTLIQLATRKQYLDVIKILVEYNADVGVVTTEGDTLLHLSLTPEKKTAIDYAADHLIKIDEASGGVLMCTNLRSSDLEILKFYLDLEKIPINSTNNNGETVLDLAMKLGKLEVGEFLRSRGASSNFYF